MIALSAGLLAGGAVFLFAGPWFHPTVAARTGQAGLIVTTASSILAAYAITWVPFVIALLLVIVWYEWLARRAYLDVSC